MASLRSLVAAVECRGNHNNPDVWETIAAFDVHKIAEDYADQCRAAGRFEYRVVDLAAAHDADRARLERESFVAWQEGRQFEAGLDGAAT